MSMKLNYLLIFHHDIHRLIKGGAATCTACQ
jgi:hypothetical protein